MKIKAKAKIKVKVDSDVDVDVVFVGQIVPVLVVVRGFMLAS